MESSLSGLSDLIHKIKCKYRHNKKWETCGCCLDYTIAKDELILYKRLYCNQDYEKKLMES